MLRMLRTLFCRDTSFFFHTYYHLRLRCRNSTFDSSTRRLDRDAVGTCLGASISSDHFPSFENVENFVLSWNIQNVHPFHPRPTETDWRNFVNWVTFFWRKISLQPGVFCWALSVRFSFLIFCIISGSKDIANWILYFVHHTVIVCPPVSLLFSRSPICGAGSERLSFTGLDSSSGGLKCWDRKLKSLSSFGRLVPLSVWLQLTTESEFTFTDWKIVQWRRLLVVDDKVLTDCLRSTPIDERGPGGQQSSSAFADVELRRNEQLSGWSCQ